VLARMFLIMTHGVLATADIGTCGLGCELTALSLDKESSAMPTLTITSINCHTTSNGMGADDLYILVNGQKVFSAEVDEGENPQVNFQMEFTKHAIIQIWEDDSGSDDDFLGQHQVNPEPRGESSFHVDGDGSDYWIHYRVS
jgi:hypothetical protein